MEKSTNKFVVDAVLSPESICNLKREEKFIFSCINNNRNVVLYGLRNTGKTSLVKSVIIPKFMRAEKDRFALFVDFMGVQSMEQVIERVHRAIEISFQHYFPRKAQFQKILEIAQNLRPTLSLDPIEGPKVSLELKSTTPSGDLHEIFYALKMLRKKYEMLLVFDEFQDIHHIKGCEAIFRNEFQNLPSGMPILILGSKKNLLAKIFAYPKAPLAGFGDDLEIAPIPYEEYHAYIEERFQHHGIKLPEEESHYLQDLMGRIPEGINIVCIELINLFARTSGTHSLSKHDIFAAVKSILDKKQGRFEEYLSHFTPAEQKFLVAVSKGQPIAAPQGKDFVIATRLSQKGLGKIAKKMEDQAVIHRTKDGLIMTEPLLREFLRNYR